MRIQRNNKFPGFASPRVPKICKMGQGRVKKVGIPMNYVAADIFTFVKITLSITQETAHVTINETLSYYRPGDDGN